MPPLTFEIFRTAADCQARLGRVTTRHGSFDTPAFMPVGTQGTVKGLLPQMVAQLGSQIILANTYHLMLRPGPELVARMGGLHAWTTWRGPILTDSGGFQVFSLSDINRIGEDGVEFKSHLDGSTVWLSPQRSMEVQNQLGADIIMAFDDCPPAGTPAVQSPGSRVQSRGPGPAVQSPESRVQSRGEEAEGDAGSGSSTLDSGPWTLDSSRPPRDSSRLRTAVERSARWLAACVAAHARPHDQALFGIVQGGTDLALRTQSAALTTAHQLPGYAIGGVAVGEGFGGLKAVVEHTAPLLPADRPRYLMGVGYERDILTAVRAGVDMFDCVLPTRNGRNACAFTPTGQLRLRNARFADDPGVIDPTCDCPACGGGKNLGFGIWDWGFGASAPRSPSQSGNRQSEIGNPGGFSRSYLRHLFMAGEMLGPILVSAHNVRHFQRYLLDIRRAIADNDWSFIASRWPVAMG